MVTAFLMPIIELCWLAIYLAMLASIVVAIIYVAEWLRERFIRRSTVTIFDSRRDREREDREEKEILDADKELINIDHAENKEIILLHRILRVLQRIEQRLEGGGGSTPSGIAIDQIIGGLSMPVTGIVKGATGTFAETPTPAGTVFPAGTTFVWTSDDTLTSLTPSADGTSVAVATSASDPAASFNLTCTTPNFTDPATGQPMTATANVPLTGGGTGNPTGIAINQLS